MIYTCTLNPAIDLFIETEHLKKEVVIYLRGILNNVKYFIENKKYLT